jgi:signal transduction histidine kinase/CheY-like chemotaxis protein
MALASILPVLLVVLAIVSLFWQGRAQDLEASHQQRVNLLAHQVALFSAYGLFSGNTLSLQRVVEDIQREPGVKAVLVFNTAGDIVARSGESTIRRFDEIQASNYAAQQRQRLIDIRTDQILPSTVPIEDIFSQGGPSKVTALGNALIEVSRQDLEKVKRDALLTAIWIGIIGMLMGGLLAYRLGAWVVGPIVRISGMVKRIGEGNFAIQDDVQDGDPLWELQASLNQMATRLSWGRDELERQVETVTQALRLKKEQAESATLAKSRFLAAASHDLRQPSHALGMFVARLGQLPMDAQMRELVDNLEISVQAMQDLLDGLLDLSRLDSGNLQVRISAVDLNELLSSVRNSLASMAEAKGLRLHIRPTRLWAYSDASMLQRMLVNLAINAIRYTERGTVLVACRPHAQGNGVRIEIWDSGIGIPAEHHEDIFKEFYQLSNRAGDRNFGMGLGLNIVQRSAALLGHSIALRSEVGCGTRFTLMLEAAPQLQAAPQNLATQSDETLGDINGMRVLLIEDNDNARKAVTGLLQSWGCTVYVASSLAEAQDHLADAGIPDIILSDFHLGTVEDGIVCIQTLRKISGHPIPACLISGDTNDDFLQAVIAADLPLLHKPLRPAKLRSLLRRMKI